MLAGEGHGPALCSVRGARGLAPGYISLGGEAVAAGRLQEGWGSGGKGLGGKPVFPEVPVLEMGASRRCPHEALADVICQQNAVVCDSTFSFYLKKNNILYSEIMFPKGI